jgi:hypothetical protein
MITIMGERADVSATLYHLGWDRTDKDAVSWSYRLAERDTGGSTAPSPPRGPMPSTARIGLSPRPAVRADEHSGPMATHLLGMYLQAVHAVRSHEPTIGARRHPATCRRQS